MNLTPEPESPVSGPDDPAEPLDEAFIHTFAAAAEDMLDDEDHSFTLPTSDPDPVNWKQALKSVSRKHWLAARAKEFDKLEELETWSRMKPDELPAGAKAIGSKIVTRTKRDGKGRITGYKVRAVAKGFAQVEGRDFKETFAPVAKFTSIRILLALAAKHGYEVHQADVDSAFVQATLDPSECVYINPPEGAPNDYKGIVLKLNKALYGLKQSARLWNNLVHSDLVALGYRRTRTDACIYVKDLPNGRRTYIGLYVDDLLLVGADLDEFQKVKDLLHGKYGIKDLGRANLLLGIQIEFNEDGSITLQQRAYLEACLERFGLTGCKTLSTPLDPNLQLEPSSDVVDPNLRHRYLQAIGCLMYAMLGTRVRLHRGYVYNLSGGAVSWASKRQTRVAKSTTDAEYISLGNAGSEAVHLGQQLQELGEPLTNPLDLYGDNQGSITLTKEARFHNAMKCVRLSEHLARELVETGIIKVTYIPTTDMVADIMTKSLPRPAFEKFRLAMGVTPLRSSGGIATP
ncbi:hypothetical protein RQP46_011086 [Phenoliferia psychrophenolica]